MFFSRSMLASIFNRFSEARNVKNSKISPRREHDFHKIDVFEKVTKKTLILASLSEAKMEKIRKTWN